MSDDKPRRARADSTESITAALLASSRNVQPPADMPLNDGEAQVFAEIVAEIPKVDITSHQIRIAAMLARTVRMHEIDTALLAEEGNIIPDRHGVPMVNPRAKVVQQFASQVLSFRRTLGLTARSLAGGDSRRVAISRAHNLASEHLRDDLDDDEELFARPPADFNPKQAH